MKRAIICVGISGSGKSTWAKEFQKENEGTVIIERDVIRRETLAIQGKIDNTMNLWSAWRFTKEAESNVTEIINTHIDTAIGVKCETIISSDTNLNKKYSTLLADKFIANGYTVEYKYFPIDLAEAWKRDEKRRDTVGRNVIYKQYNQYLELVGRKRYIPDSTKKKCVLVDVDGTVAHMINRSPFEWSRVDEDEVDTHVKNLLLMIAMWSGIDIIFLSGRDGVCRDSTEKWFLKHGVPYDDLYMRMAGDMRKDSIVKEELFWKYIEPNYDVQFVFDDRPQMTRLWREMGLKVFDVGDPYSEF